MKKSITGRRVVTGVLAVLLVASVMLSGCATKKTNPDSPEVPTSNAAFPMSFKNYGRTVTLKQKPRKVLALGPNCAEVFAALGLEDLVVGTSLRNHSRGPLPEFKEAVDKMPEMNHGPATREAVLSSGADFIYGIDWEFGDEGLEVKKLEEFGITTYQAAATTKEEAYQEILDMGKIFGKEKQAERIVADQKQRIKEAGDKQSQSDKPVKVLVYDSGNNGVFTASDSNFETLLIEDSGGTNIFGDLKDKAWATVSYEEVLKRQPEVIVIHDYDSPSVKEKIAEIKSNPTLSQLDCVKKERFVTIELESVLPPIRMAYAVEKLTKGFHL
jgi:iron complex transport system substrate-binding protein